VARGGGLRRACVVTSSTLTRRAGGEEAPRAWPATVVTQSMMLATVIWAPCARRAVVTAMWALQARLPEAKRQAVATAAGWQWVLAVCLAHAGWGKAVTSHLAAPRKRTPSEEGVGGALAPWRVPAGTRGGLTASKRSVWAARPQLPRDLDRLHDRSGNAALLCRYTIRARQRRSP
jgi:hypothetical protein